MKELPVGEELNALLHEHVFGGCAHEWILSPDGSYYGCKRCHTMAASVQYSLQDLPKCGDDTNYLDGNGMLKVVGKMRELGYYADVHFWQNGRAAVIFQRTTVMFPDGEAGDDDAPTATGQAALRALGVI